MSMGGKSLSGLGQGRMSAASSKRGVRHHNALYQRPSCATLFVMGHFSRSLKQSGDGNAIPFCKGRFHPSRTVEGDGKSRTANGDLQTRSIKRLSFHHSDSRPVGDAINRSMASPEFASSKVPSRCCRGVFPFCAQNYSPKPDRTTTPV